MRNIFDTSKYIIIPYKNRGRDFNGCDCWGLIYLIYLNEYSIQLPILSNEYSDASEGKKISETIQKNKPLINNLKKEDPEYGDIIIFNMKGYPCHAGIFIGNNKVIHTLKGSNSGIERLDSFRMKGRIEGYYEII